jgi:hypothetical protein
MMTLTLRHTVRPRVVFVTGTFLCLDKQMNLLMRDTKESRPENEQSARHLGLVLVPFQHVKACAAFHERREMR